MLVGLFGLLFRSISPFPEFKQYGKILYRRVSRLIEFYPILIQLDVLENFGSSFVVVPEPRA